MMLNARISSLERVGDSSYGVIGLSEEASGLMGMPLAEYNKTLCSSEEAAWSLVLSGGYAIVDSTFAYGLVGVDGLGQSDGTITISSDAGSVDAVIVGVMDQRLLPAVMISLSDAQAVSGLSGPNMYVVDFADGLDAGEQSGLLEASLVSEGATVMDLSEEAARALRALNDAALSLRIMTRASAALGVLGAGALCLRTVSDRSADLSSLRRIGVTARGVRSMLLLETAVPAAAGLAAGIAAGVTLSRGIWAMFLRDMGLAWSYDAVDVLTTNAITFALVLIVLCALFRSAPGPAQR